MARMEAWLNIALLFTPELRPCYDHLRQYVAVRSWVIARSVVGEKFRTSSSTSCDNNCRTTSRAITHDHDRSCDHRRPTCDILSQVVVTWSQLRCDCHITRVLYQPVLACGFCSNVFAHSGGTNLLGGKDATDNVAWLAVIIGNDGEQESIVCHGSLVHESYVLTARGCVENGDIGFREVLLGTVNPADPTDFQRIPVSAVHNITNDADLLELASAADTNVSTVEVLELADADDLATWTEKGSDCSITGYGSQGIGGGPKKPTVKVQAPSFTHTMPIKKTPQMVYFGFDDAINRVVTPYYKQLFNSPDRTNPNGCTHKITLFVSNEYTNYVDVKNLYDEGHEIGVHSLSHGHIKTKKHLRHEAMEQKENLVNAGIPEDELLGWRSPFLEPAAEQPVVLKNLDYGYDASIGYYALGDDRPWPFTMENGWPYTCKIDPCPTVNDSVSNFWQVPINTILDVTETYPCVYVDACLIRPNNANESFDFLMNNFLRTYNHHKAPFGIHMHPHWFQYQHNLEGMERFLEALTEMDDVYVVTIKQMLDWMRNPTQLDQLDKLPSWSCSDDNDEIDSLPPPKSSSVVYRTTNKCKKLSTFDVEQDHCIKASKGSNTCEVDAGAPVVCDIDGVPKQVGMEYGKWKAGKNGCSKGPIAVLKASSLKAAVNSKIGG